MTAKEAREKAAKKKQGTILSEYSQVIKAIKDEVSRGGCAINYYKYISADVVNKLKLDGYKIDQGIDGRNETYCYINW